MENKSPQKELSEFFIEEIIKSNPIFLKEAQSNSMATTTITPKIIWRPNNYRRKIEVKEKTNSGINKIRTTIPTSSYSAHTKMLSIKDYLPNITIQYGKNTLTGIYSQNRIGGVKEHFLIERESIDEINKAIDEKKEKIRERIDIALDRFIVQFKLRIQLKKPEWDRYEDFVKGEEYIDKIPSEVIIHDTFFKKVYGQGIEFKNSGKGESPVVHMKNYIKNRAVEDISPQIAEEINTFRNSTEIILAQFAEQIKLHLGVLGGIDKSFKKFNRLLDKLSQKKLTEFR